MIRRLSKKLGEPALRGIDGERDLEVEREDADELPDRLLRSEDDPEDEEELRERELLELLLDEE